MFLWVFLLLQLALAVTVILGRRHAASLAPAAVSGKALTEAAAHGLAVFGADHFSCPVGSVHAPLDQRRAGHVRL